MWVSWCSIEKCVVFSHSEYVSSNGKFTLSNETTTFHQYQDTPKETSLVFICFIKEKVSCFGVPAVVQQNWQRLGSAGMKVRFLVWHSGLRIWRCCSCSFGCDYGSDLIPGLGAPRAVRWPEKKEKKKKKVSCFIFKRYISPNYGSSSGGKFLNVIFFNRKIFL